MIINMTGGGAGLVLKVVGGTAAPANPAENTVWVSTDTEINGYAFSATQPENPAEGFVWILTSINSTAAMNIDKKNAVMLYPLRCMQYINGAWVIKTALTYQNGAWKEWRTYLYYKGDECTEVTGGWTVVVSDNGTGKKTDSLYVYSSGGDTYQGQLRTTNKIDLTNVNTIGFDLTEIKSKGPLISASANTNLYDGYAVRINHNAVGVGAMDVSSLSGEYYVFLVGNPKQGGGNFSQVWME